MDAIDKFVDKSIDSWWQKKKFPLRGNGRTRLVSIRRWWCDWTPRKDSKESHDNAQKEEA